jgi:hypothetical protein
MWVVSKLTNGKTSFWNGITFVDNIKFAKKCSEKEAKEIAKEKGALYNKLR